MGQSLAGAAVSGMSSIKRATEEQELLAAGDIEGLIAVKRSIFGGATMMADDDTDDDDGDDQDDSDDDDDDDDEDDDSEDDGKSKKLTASDKRIQELSAEGKRRRLRMREQRAEIERLKIENAELAKGKKKAKDKDDDGDDEGSEQTSQELKEAKSANEKLVRQSEDLLIRLEFTDLVNGPKAKHRFKNNKAALKLLDLDDVEITEDGDVEGLEEAVDELAKEHPYLLDKGSDDDEDDDEDDKPKSRRRTGQPTRTTTKRRKATGDRGKLVSKYPALRR